MKLLLFFLLFLIAVIAFVEDLETAKWIFIFGGAVLFLIPVFNLGKDFLRFRVCNHCSQRMPRDAAVCHHCGKEQ